MAATGATFITLLVLVSPVIHCARILVYIATPSFSHQVVYRSFSKALAARGHEVFLVTTDPEYPDGNAPENLTEIDVHDASYQDWEEIFQFHRGVKEDLVEEFKIMFKKFALNVDAQWATPGVQQILSKDKDYFDIMLLESNHRTLLGLIHKFDAPVVALSPAGAISIQYSAFGAPAHPFLYPTLEQQKLYNLSLLEKATELFKHVMLNFIIYDLEEFDLKIMRKNFGDDVPHFSVLEKSIVMWFLNEHPFWADNRPIPPNFLYVSGIYQPQEKDLPKDLENFLNSSAHGVIYVSFGNNVLPSQLPPEKIEMMAKVFSRLPYDVLWKYDKEVLPGQSKNIKVSNWFPQSDLLRHPKIKLFITHGGLRSTEEAIKSAVPLVGIPMSGDQWYNVQKYVHHGIGLQLDIVTLTEEEFKENVERVIQNQSFKDNILKVRAIMTEYPISPLDKAVWWTEHIIKTGGEHLRPPAAFMSVAEYYEVKLVLIVLSVVITIVAAIARLVKTILKLIFKLYRFNIKLKRN